MARANQPPRAARKGPLEARAPASPDPNSQAEEALRGAIRALGPASLALAVSGALQPATGVLLRVCACPSHALLPTGVEGAPVRRPAECMRRSHGADDHNGAVTGLEWRASVVNSH